MTPEASTGSRILRHRYWLGTLLLFALFVLSVPGAERYRVQVQREQVIENLELIMAAKQAMLIDKNFIADQSVTLDDLVANGTVLTERPVFPDGEGPLQLNTIEQMPTYEFRGELLNPLANYGVYEFGKVDLEN